MGIESPKKKDDFQVIHGIGPAIERRLYDAGICTYADLAGIPLSDLHALVDNVPGMTIQKLAAEDWPAQARARMTDWSVPAPADRAFQATTLSDNNQHYATFKVQLLLDQQSVVRSTQVECIQDKCQERWAGWDEYRLVEFIVQHAGVLSDARTPAVITQTQVSPMLGQEASPTASVSSNITEEDIKITGLAVLPVDSLDDRRVISHAEPFSVTLTFALPVTAVFPENPVRCTAVIRARELGNGSKITVAEKQENIRLGDCTTVTMPGTQLPRGIYRLEAILMLVLSPATRLQASLVDAGLLQAY